MDITEKYAQRIAEATPLQLVIILHELIIEYINDGASKSDIDKACSFLGELFSSLNMDMPIAEDLANLFLFVNRLLIRAKLTRKDDEKNQLLADGRKIISGLLNSWEELEKNDDLENTIFNNPQQIFAGLTYEKGGKLSEFLDDDPNRGYKV
ncbi:MAG: flagellar protein FliS [Defluviitaleaceae bacterium]|nr:flagellar protein FliS [Defluviitaleaceae bacterium]